MTPTFNHLLTINETLIGDLDLMNFLGCIISVMTPVYFIYSGTLALFQNLSE